MTERQGPDTRERVQIIALGVHGITDRFSVHEQAFGSKLRDASVDLIEDITAFEVARKRDAAGTAQLIHKLICEADTLRSLLSFVKNRGLAKEATVDILIWELEQLLGDLEREDAQFEEHVSRHHPQAAPVHAGPVTASIQPPVPSNVSQAKQGEVEGQPKPSHASTPKRADTQPEVRTLSSDRKSFDPLLGPDSTAAFFAKTQPSASTRVEGATATAATAVSEAPTAVATPPVALPIVAMIEKQRTQAQAETIINDRQKTIIELFKVEREAPLKRIMAILPNVSEKTVRNDLLELVRRGFLKRIGTAPRSKYVLA